MSLPEWAEKQKKRGYEIKYIHGNYYMYERKSVWDPKRAKAKKVTGAYVGKVTPDGIVSKKTRNTQNTPVFSVEYGAVSFLTGLSGDLLPALCERFSDDTARRLWVIAALRLIAPCPLNRIVSRYESSWISRALPGLALSPASISRLLDYVGANRAECTAFMRGVMPAAPYLLIDGTGTVSRSEGITRALPGHSNSHGYIPQVNQVYILAISEGGGMPAFYRNVAGNIPDVTAFSLTVNDAGIGNATVVADAGFASGDNFAMLGESELDYIVPLRRNTAEVVLEQIEYENVFDYHHRAISAHTEKKDGYRICVFRDEKLRAEEMADFVGRKEKANSAAEQKKKFVPERDLHDVSGETKAKLHTFGTIILRTSIMNGDERKIYETYKLRWEIEQLFDTMRNTLCADTSFMQDDPGFEGWTFINHLSLLMACRVLSMIREKKMAKDWSLAGMMDHLSRIYAVQIAGKWHLAEVIKKTKKMLDTFSIKLDLNADMIPKS